MFVCDNLAFSGEIKIARKHTRFVVRDLPGLVSGAVGQLSDRWHAQAQRIDVYRRHELTDVQAHDLIVRALDNRAITITQVPAILKEWRVPRNPEFAADGKTVWRFFNAVTSSAATVIRSVSCARPGRGSSALKRPRSAGEARISFACMSSLLLVWSSKNGCRSGRADAKQIRRDAFREADAHREILRELHPVKFPLHNGQTGN